jgi:hypothetical protein
MISIIYYQKKTKIQNPQIMRIIRDDYFFKSNKLKHDKENYAPNQDGYHISYDPKVEKKYYFKNILIISKKEINNYLMNFNLYFDVKFNFTEDPTRKRKNYFSNNNNEKNKIMIVDDNKEFNNINIINNNKKNKINNEINKKKKKNDDIIEISDDE